MSTKQITLSESIDEAVERLPFFRRKVYQRRLKNNRFRKAFVEDLTVKLYDNDEVAGMVPVATFAGESFGEDTPFSIDIDNFERFLQIIIEYLPKIMEIIVTLLALGVVPFFVVLSLSIGGSAVAGPPVVSYEQSPDNFLIVARKAPIRSVVRSIVNPQPLVVPVAVAAPERTIEYSIPVASRQPINWVPARTTQRVFARRYSTCINCKR